MLGMGRTYSGTANCYFLSGTRRLPPITLDLEADVSSSLLAEGERFDLRPSRPLINTR